MKQLKPLVPFAILSWLVAGGPLFAKDVDFSKIMHRYANATSLQTDELERQLPGNTLVGTGRVVEVAECGFWDAQYCLTGLKIVVGSGDDRAYVYFPVEARQKVLEVESGEKYVIKNCKILAIVTFITENSIFCQMAE